MVELRKRKAPAPPPVAEKKTKQTPKPKESPNASDNDIEKNPAPKVPEVDDTIDIETFGGEIETNEGDKTTLKKLLEESKSGVVFFTYPKASTPGCELFCCFEPYIEDSVVLCTLADYLHLSFRYQASLLVP